MSDVHQITYAGYFEKTLKRYIHEALKQNNPNYDRDARVAAAAAKKSSEDVEPKMFRWSDGTHHTLPEHYILTCRGDPKKKTSRTQASTNSIAGVPVLESAKPEQRNLRDP